MNIKPTGKTFFSVPVPSGVAYERIKPVSFRAGEIP